MENNTYLLKFLEKFDVKQAIKLFDKSYFERGVLHARVGNVKSILRHTPFELTAHIRDLKNFRTTIRMDRSGQAFSSLCSCPVNPGCEHAAALTVIACSMVNPKTREKFNVPVSPQLYVGLETSFEPGPGMIQTTPVKKNTAPESDLVIKYDPDLGHFAREPVYYLGSQSSLRPIRLTIDAIKDLSGKSKHPLRAQLQPYGALTTEARERQKKNIVTVVSDPLQVRYRITAERIKIEFLHSDQVFQTDDLSLLTSQKDKPILEWDDIAEKWYWMIDKKKNRLYSVKLPVSPLDHSGAQLNLDFLFEKLRLDYDDKSIAWEIPMQVNEVISKAVQPIIDVKRGDKTALLNFAAKSDAEAREMTKSFKRMRDQILDYFMAHPTKKKSTLLGELILGTYPAAGTVIKEDTENVIENWVTDILNANDEFFRLQLPQSWQTKIRRWVKDVLLKSQASLVIVDRSPSPEPDRPELLKKVTILKLPQLEIFEAGCSFYQALFQARQSAVRTGFNLDPENAQFTFLEFQALSDLILIPWLREKKGGLRIDSRGTSLAGTMKARVQLSEEKDGWFQSSLAVTFADGRMLSHEEIKRIKTEAESLLEMPGGSEFILFDDEEIKRVRKMASLPSKLRKFQVGEALNVDKDVVVENLPGWIDRLVESVKDGAKIKPLTLPEFKGELRAYQKQGTLWLKLLYDNDLGGVLCDDMGLGKTVQVLAFLSHLKSEKKLGKSLIVCPTSLLWNWAAESEKFAPHLPIHVFHGSPRALPQDMSKDLLVITSFGLVRSDDRLREIKWDNMIIDEAHMVKQRSSLVHQALVKVDAKFRAGLTGTPVENHPVEFGNLFNLILPGIFNSDEQDVDVLRRRSRLFLLRRSKEDHLKELPQKTVSEIFLEPGTKQKAFYQKTAEEAASNLQRQIHQQGWEKSQLNVLTALMRLRQICGSAKLVDPEMECDSGKLEWLQDFLPQLLQENHSVLVFSQFTKLLDEIEDWLETEDLAYKRLDGSTSATKRKKAVADFAKDRAEVFLLSLKAGGVGLNLTQASYVVVMDPWWNPAVEAQAIDRAHRMGQKKPVTVYRPIIRGSLEERILRLQKQKKELFNTLVGSDTDMVLDKLKPEDIFELLK